MGLAPAKSNADTTVSLRLSDPSTSASDRAVIPGGGFLYIQTGSTAADAKLYGPWEASSGKPFTTNEIPAGVYDSFSIFYLETPSLNAPVLVSSDHPTILSALQSMLVDVPDTLDSCSCATLSGVVIRASRVNSLKSALVPATTTLLTVSSDGFLSSMPAATTGMARRFFRITPGSACSSSQVPDAFTFSLQADGSLSVSLIALYGSDGTLLGMNSDAVTLATGESRSWNIPCISPQDASCYLFIEYEGSIAAHNPAPESPTVPVGPTVPSWYVSNSGGGDGSDITHTCTLDEAISLVNDSTYSGTCLIILTDDSTTTSQSLRFNRDVRLCSSSTARFTITYTGSVNNSLPLFYVGDGTNSPKVSFANCTIDGGSLGTGKYLLALVDIQSGSLTLEAGATLQNNGADDVAQFNGGAVKVESYTSFEMLNGSCITGCSAGNGGAVYVYGGTFTMEGGSILSCKVTDLNTGSGGAVYIGKDTNTNMSGSFIMNNGFIGSPSKGCSAILGGAIGVKDGIFTLKDGTISNCSAVDGGAVSVDGGNAKAEFTGGTIENCDAAGSPIQTNRGLGGAVYLLAANSAVNFKTSGNAACTVMNGNTAKKNGSNLYKTAGTVVNVDGFPSDSTYFPINTGYDTATIAWF